MDFDFSFLDTFSPVGNTEFSLAGMSQDFPEIATSEGMFELASNQLAGRAIQSLLSGTLAELNTHADKTTTRIMSAGIPLFPAYNVN
ncbi:hypothetical protein SNOG_11487 [Parastagonospora nodorum SN15]|uniref:Uncharacterized protein n=1 Tax=Phaeosphaeria nodorum (strain SN15 / ATCC MYA-4574 / FGSC 10173) TaxID=321614 RepID=Q0U9S7_PHANO|nr:hypothetical protein SNOG_11487 [Parastagonospora nodorum SN15]EAT81195.1 hypothetical protein SNOG_11487 [Parastagonospora nodorum SN15]